MRYFCKPRELMIAKGFYRICNEQEKLHTSYWCPSMIFFLDICWPVFLIPAKCLTSFCWIVFFDLCYLMLLCSLLVFFSQVSISCSHSKLFLTEMYLWSFFIYQYCNSLILLPFLPDLIHAIIPLCHWCLQCLGHLNTFLLSRSTAA